VKASAVQLIVDKSDLSGEPILPNPNKSILPPSAAKVNVQE
jgi:hypothetical protein